MRLLRSLAGFAVGLFVLLVGISAASAQDAGPAPRANAGDILRVDVEGRPDISGNVTVEKSGEITLPTVGRVAAVGRTASEIGTDIARRMSLVSSKITQVTVTFLQVASRRNYVLGAVLLPGMYVFRELPTVWDAIAEAGGPTDDADLSTVEVFSESQAKPTIVDVTAGSAGDVSKLPRLRAGDTVRVPRQSRGGAMAAKDVVYVLGAVGFQGPLPLSETPDLVSAFIRSGPSQSVDFKNVEIVRRNGLQVVRMNIRMSEYFDRGDLVGNPMLQSGDTIHFQREKGAFSPLRVVGALASIVGLTASIVALAR